MHIINVMVQKQSPGVIVFYEKIVLSQEIWTRLVAASDCWREPYDLP